MNERLKARKDRRELRIVVESKHGEHRDISEAIARRLQQKGYEVEVKH